MSKIRENLLPSLLVGSACRRMIGGDRWRGSVIDRLRIYFLLQHAGKPVLYKDLRKFSILKSDNSLTSLIGHLISDGLIIKTSRTYTITDEGLRDFETLIDSLNCYAKLILQNYLTIFPDCSELKKLLQECKRVDHDIYKKAIQRFGDADAYLFAKARITSQSEKISFEKALTNTYHSICDVLYEFVQEFCGK